MKKLICFACPAIGIIISLIAGCNVIESRSIFTSYNHDEPAVGNPISVLLDANESEYHISVPNISNRTFYLDIEPGDLPIDSLHYIFTNASNGSYLPTAKVTRISTTGAIAHNDTTDTSEVAVRSVVDFTDDEYPVFLYGTPEISEYNQRLPGDDDRPRLFSGLSSGRAASAANRNNAPETRSVVGIGSSNIFYTDLAGNERVPATVQYQATHDGIELNIWVADDQWCPTERLFWSGDIQICGRIFPSTVSEQQTAAPDLRLTSDMVRIIGERFLKNGPMNDIYDWGIDLFGEPWGAHNHADLIAPNNASAIDILLYDIDADRNINNATIGIFFSKDNQRRSAELPGSNERLMFYIDSYFYAYSGNDRPWNIDNPHPQSIISSLAHEFQHMILYYQRSVTRGIRTELWLNEMLSLMFEDIIADELGIIGPRATREAVPTRVIRNGRLLYYNCNNDNSLTIWQDNANVLNDYGIVYAFGAYLLRNFGAGAPPNNILPKIYASDKEGTDAIVAATGVDFDVLLRDWAVASLLSDHIRSVDTQAIHYNNGDWFPDGTDSSTIYRVGSINLYKYRSICRESPGPYSWLSSQAVYYQFMNRHPPASNIYLLAGENIRTPQRYKITVPAGMSLSIVARR